MAHAALGEDWWRILRRVVGLPWFRYTHARNGTRLDRSHFRWLVNKGFVADLGDDWFESTAKGRAAAELGLYDA